MAKKTVTITFQNRLGLKAEAIMQYDREAMAAELMAKAAKTSQGFARRKGTWMVATPTTFEFNEEEFLRAHADGPLSTTRWLFGGKLSIKTRLARR